MDEILVGVISVFAGCLIVVLRKFFSNLIIKQQNKFWGFHFGEVTTKTTEFVSLIVGAGFIIMGLLFVFRIIRFK